ncbi:MAG TPA: hypothetical protein VGR62_25365 [Candidatus Binatia bacterium]|jgi:hypothetical protein|nr:hypothetical protein [Candidatus Binatia bacterium]
MIRRLVVLAVLAAVGVAAAQERPCAPDIKKFCAGVPPGEGAQRQCLKQHEVELSIECQRYRIDVQKALTVAMAGCQPDVKALCKGQKGRRRVVACLREHDAQISPTCKKSLQIAP